MVVRAGPWDSPAVRYLNIDVDSTQPESFYNFFVGIDPRIAGLLKDGLSSARSEGVVTILEHS